MHEHSFIDAIIRDIEDKANVEKIILEVGGLVGIDLFELIDDEVQ